MIEILRTVNQCKVFRENLKKQTVGIVPTMGNLHKGHLSLVLESLRNNDVTMVTIFVNPTQFGPNEDFEKYPRTLGADALSLKELYRLQNFTQEKRLAIFAPETVEDIYPAGFSTVISLPNLSQVMCGESRPGHFDGVATVVYRLFSLINPCKAYFGQKDYQQYLIIKRMIEDLSLNIQLVPMPTKRDENGLALSSRNNFLSEEDYNRALVLPNTIDQIKKIIKNSLWSEAFERSQMVIAETLKDKNWDYLDIRDATDLNTPHPATHTIVVAGAYKSGATRLIDNKLVEINNV